MRIILYPYKMGSRSSRELARGLSALRVYPDGRYRPRADDVIINWGNSVTPDWFDRVRGVFLNHPDSIALSSNKLRTFENLRENGIPTLNWTTDPNIARQWRRIVVRHRLTGHSGEGMEVIDNQIGGTCGECGAMCASCVTNTPTIPIAPLYTELKSNTGEYRVHVFNGEVVDYTKKRREREDDPTQAENDMRTLANGWIFTRGNLTRLERVEELALRAVESLGLDFGAVDILKDSNGDVFVVEVNTAVGLAPTTLSNYITTFNRFIENI